MQSANLEMLKRIAALPCPLVGIPMPGLRPFSCQRTVLAQLIEGLNGDTRIELTLRGARTPELRVSSDSGRRGFTLLGKDASYHGNGGSVYGRQLAWAKRQREAKGVNASGKPTSLLKLEKAIGVQERKLKSWKHCKPHAPDSVLCWPSQYSKPDQADREAFAAWRAQKAERRRIFAIVKGSWPAESLCYRALKNAGYPVLTYSKLLLHTRERVSRNKYWRHIYEWVDVHRTAAHRRFDAFSMARFVSKPTLQGESSRSLHEVERDRMEYADKMRDYRNDLERLEYLKAQIASYGAE